MVFNYLVFNVCLSVCLSRGGLRSGSAGGALPDLESISHVGLRVEPVAAQLGLLADAAHQGLWHDGPRAVEEFALDAVTFRFGLDLSLDMVYAAALLFEYHLQKRIYKRVVRVRVMLQLSDAIAIRSQSRKARVEKEPM